MNDKKLKENKHGSPLFPLHIYSHQDPTGIFSVPHHWHDEIEFLYIEQGEMKINLSGKTLQAKAGDLYFINRQDLHQVSAASSSTKHYAIVFSPEILEFELYDYCQSYYITPLIKDQLKFPSEINAYPHCREIITQEFKQAIRAYRNKNTGWPITVKACLFKILALLIEEELIIIQEKQSADDDKIKVAKKIISYIQNNYQHKITLEEVADISNMSPQYFCTFFKSMFGKTLIEYINEYRIEKACELLRQEKLKIIEISMIVGFDNFSYFIKKFKHFKQCTPSTYRKM